MKRLLGLMLTAAVPGVASALEWNMPVGVTDISREVFDLHMLIFWIVTIIGIGVFGVMFYSVFAHRKSKGAESASFHHSTAVEIVWTTIPFLILIGMAIPAAGTLIKMEDTSGAEMTVKITGYQWMWEYDYIDSDVKIYSRLHPDHDAARQLNSGIDVSTIENYLVEVDNRVVLPVDTKIRFMLTSNDVLHAWWMPDFAIKKDAVPGFVREMWTTIDEPGVYRGRCAELCGRDHGFMPIVVEAVSKADYAKWIAEQGGTMADGAGSEAVATVDAVLGGEDRARVVKTADAPAQQPQQTQPTQQAPQAAEAAPAQAPAAQSGQAAQAAPAAPAAAAETSRADLMAMGETVYNQNCAACHQKNGTGIPPQFPSLHGAPIIQGPATAQIAQILSGKGVMPAFRYLSDDKIAAAVTYTRNSWGNDSGVVQPADVAALR